MELDFDRVQKEITNIIDSINTNFGLGAKITATTCPNDIGISSHIIISVMGNLEAILNISIPNSCYIFHDKKSNTHLSIKEASLKLIKMAKIL